MEFIESDLKFVFDEQQWDFITQFDIEKDYTKVKNSLSETKAIDFLGIQSNRLYLFEIKGFRGYGDQESVQKRLAKDAEDLTTEIAQKVRDTLACLLGGARNSTNQSDNWQKCCEIIAKNNHKLIVVAWIEEDIKNKIIEKRKKVKNSIRQDKLKQKLSWLTKHIFIVNTKTDVDIAGFSVSLLHVG